MYAVGILRSYTFLVLFLTMGNKKTSRRSFRNGTASRGERKLQSPMDDDVQCQIQYRGVSRFLSNEIDSRKFAARVPE